MSVQNPFDDDDDNDLENALFDIYGIPKITTTYIATTETKEQKDIQKIKEKFKQRKNKKVDITIPIVETVFHKFQNNYKFQNNPAYASDRVFLRNCTITDIKQSIVTNQIKINVSIEHNNDHFKIPSLRYAKGRLGFTIADKNNTNKNKTFTLEGKIESINEGDYSFEFIGKNISGDLYMYYHTLKEKQLLEKTKQEEEERKKNRILTRRIHFD